MRAKRASIDDGTPRALPERHVRGRLAEALACRQLEASGFRILWRNLRLGYLELDIVARRRELVVVVEVRARGSGAYETALGSISFTKRRTLLRGVRALWRTRLVKMRGVARLRIDVAAVTFDGDAAHVEWIAGALTADDG